MMGAYPLAMSPARRFAAVASVLLVGGGVALLAFREQRGASSPSAAPPVAEAPSPPPPTSRTDLKPLPPYILNVAFGPVDLVADAAGDPHGPSVIVVSGDELEIVVRPEREVPEKVTVKVYWHKNGKLACWRVPAELGVYSTHRFRGRSNRPFGRGPGQLLAVVSPVPDVPDDLPAAWLQRPPRHWQVLRQTVRWR